MTLLARARVAAVALILVAVAVTLLAVEMVAGYLRDAARDDLPDGARLETRMLPRSRP